MDEPFAALDEITRFRLNNDLLALWQSLGKTVVFVTHSVFELVYSLSASRDDAAAGPRVTEFDRRSLSARRDAFAPLASYAANCRQVSEALSHAMGEER